jgi:hypothetical protein
MAVTCGVARLPRTGKQITAGQRVADVSEDRHAPYVHDRHRPDHRVFAGYWRWAMNGADRVIRWSTALAVLGVAAVAAVASLSMPAISCKLTVSQGGRLTWSRSRWTG